MTTPSTPSFAAVAAFLFAVTRWSPAAATAGQELDLVLVHANDTHSRFDEIDARGTECGEADAARGRRYGGFGRVARLGFITVEQLINVLPFMRTLVKITISGYTLLEAFENSVSDYVINHGGRHFLQVSDVEDYNSVAVYLKAISPVTTGIEGRINFKSTDNEKSKAPSINTSNCQLLFIISSTFMFFDLHCFI